MGNPAASGRMLALSDMAAALECAEVLVGD